MEPLAPDICRGMKSIGNCYLYGILDGDYIERDQAGVVTGKMLDGGIDIIQLRAKNWEKERIIEVGREIHLLTSERDIPLIINDHPEVAIAVGAEGTHVGKDDLPVAEVRQIVGEDHIVGLSTHSLEQARDAATQKVEYIGFGPLFSTPTKPDYTPIGTDDIAQVHEEHPELPIFCIGGIKHENAASVLEAGAKRIVVVSGILQADDVEEYTRSLKSLL